MVPWSGYSPAATPPAVAAARGLMLARMMLAGVPIALEWVPEIARMVKVAGAVELADRLDRAVNDGVALLALTIDERAIILSVLEDPPSGLTELRAVLLNEHQWRQAEGLDPLPE